MIKQARAKKIRSLRPCLKRSALILKHTEEAAREKQNPELYLGQDIQEHRMKAARRVKDRIHKSIKELQEEQQKLLNITP